MQDSQTAFTPSALHKRVSKPLRETESEPGAVATGLRLKGCQIIAGGRSVEQTTGKECPSGPYPGGVPPFF
jgi:hypothetical protein